MEPLAVKVQRFAGNRSIRPGNSRVTAAALLTFLADAEKARVWILEAMNILTGVTVVKARLRVGDGQGCGGGEKTSTESAVQKSC
jgi:hypothetical protein